MNQSYGFNREINYVIRLRDESRVAKISELKLIQNRRRRGRATLHRGDAEGVGIEM